MATTVFTVGHSTHAAEKFRELLAAHRITAVADVRSSPYSRLHAQFNRETLQRELKQARVGYVFLGRELGARSEDPSCYRAGKVQYGSLANTALFREGLERVCRGAEHHRVALLCAEKDPLTCHRCILVSRYLIARAVEVQHILADGRLESHPEALRRLVRELGLDQRELFEARGDLVEEGYRLRGEQIAYVVPEDDEREGAVAHR